MDQNVAPEERQTTEGRVRYRMDDGNLCTALFDLPAQWRDLGMVRDWAARTGRLLDSFPY